MKFGKNYSNIEDYLFKNKKRVIPIEHRAKHIKYYHSKTQQDLKIFIQAFKTETDPAFRKLIALKILEIAEGYYQSEPIDGLENDNNIDCDEIYGALKWQLPK